MSYYSTGDAAERAIQDELERQKEAREAAAKNRLRRFYMKEDASPEVFRTVTFLDDWDNPAGFRMPYVFAEHQLYRNGHWRNWYTCIEGMPHPENGQPQNCPICAHTDSKASVVSAYSVLNRDSWTNKKGEVNNADGNEFNLFVCKAKVHAQLNRKMKKSEGLRGMRVEIFRPTADDENTGSQFEWGEKETVDPKVIAPDYREVFAPMTEEQRMKVAQGKRIDGDKPPVDEQKDGSIKY